MEKHGARAPWRLEADLACHGDLCFHRVTAEDLLPQPGSETETTVPDPWLSWPPHAPWKGRTDLQELGQW